MKRTHRESQFRDLTQVETRSKSHPTPQGRSSDRDVRAYLSQAPLDWKPDAAGLECAARTVQPFPPSRRVFPVWKHPSRDRLCHNMKPICHNGLSVDEHQLVAHQQHMSQALRKTRTRQFSCHAVFLLRRRPSINGLEQMIHHDRPFQLI